MANNQITPFQLTDQFTMDNFNQRINETNTALQNKADASSVYTKTESDDLLAKKAPAGFGEGSVNGVNVQASDDLNDIILNGTYQWGDILPKNAPSKYCKMRVWNGAGWISQEVMSAYSSEKDSIRRRVYNSSKWGPWEWVNPPMHLGVEYRTTERYLGKPVYAMTVDFGNLPNATTKEITVSGVSSPNKVVSVFGYTSDYKTIPTFSYSWDAISTLNDAIALDANAHPVDGLRIHVATQYNRSSATAVVVVKYTKETD